jgi:hypothetical protein
MMTAEPPGDLEQLVAKVARLRSEIGAESASGPSVLDCDNRKWLNEEFGIQFVTLAELAKRLTAFPFTDRARALVAAAGARASYRFFEFFTAQIRNPNMRRAYASAVQEFLAWREQHGVRSIAEVQPLYVGA